MKETELLQRYEEGERNFRGADLSGKSFRGKDLSGIDLSRANIRGTDFTNAILRGVNFSGIKAGLQFEHQVALGLILLSVALVLGAATGFMDTIAELLFHRSSLVVLIPKWLTVGVLLGFAFVAIRGGIAASFSVFILSFVVAGVVAFASSAAVVAAGAIAIAITVASFIAVTAAIMTVVVTTTMLACNTLWALVVMLAFGLPFMLIAVPTAGGSAIGLAVTVMVISFAISWQAVRGSRKHAAVMSVSTSLISRWGTRFWGADLTNANFSGATLENTDFEEAILTRVCWEEGQSMDATANKTSLLFNQ